jgi:hypothetical protein
MSFTRVKPTIQAMLLAERLVGEARTRRATRMDARERIVLAASAICFVVVACGIAAFLPSERELNPFLLVGLTAGYAVIERVRFEFGGYYGTPEQLILVPIFLLIPLPYVPLVIALANVVAIVPDIVRGSWHRERFMGRFADCWFSVPPVLLLAAFAPGELRLEHAGIYALAFLAQLGGDFG